jgi:hypothetical protein
MNSKEILMHANSNGMLEEFLIRKKQLLNSTRNPNMDKQQLNTSLFLRQLEKFRFQ